jgi:hypothetical protein
MSNVIYRATGEPNGFVAVLVADEYQLQDGETHIAPPAGILLPAHLDALKGTWTGATDDEHAAYLESLQTSETVVTPQDALNAQLLKKQAAQDVSNAAIIKQMAALSARVDAATSTTGTEE